MKFILEIKKENKMSNKIGLSNNSGISFNCIDEITHILPQPLMNRWEEIEFNNSFPNIEIN